LERLLTTRIGKLDILLGYALSFGLLAILQATLAGVVALNVFGLDVAGAEWMLIIVALANALLGTALGLLASAFAQTEFQAAQFMPAFILPQLLLCGLLVPIAKLPDALAAIANVLPLTYAVDAMMRVAKEVEFSSRLYVDLAVIFGFALVAIILAAVTLKRRVK
jgi:ABC-2 type transport system permease protein